jgi:hypothetical protein
MTEPTGDTSVLMMAIKAMRKKCQEYNDKGDVDEAEQLEGFIELLLIKHLKAAITEVVKLSLAATDRSDDLRKLAFKHLSKVMRWNDNVGIAKSNDDSFIMDLVNMSLDLVFTVEDLKKIHKEMISFLIQS